MKDVSDVKKFFSLNNILFRLAELFDTTIFTIYYFMGGLLISYILDTLTPDYDPAKHKLLIILEIFIEIALTIVGAYILIRISEYIPAPFGRWFTNEKRLQLKELTDSKIRGSIMIGFAIFLLQINLKNKILFIFDRLVEEELSIEPLQMDEIG